MFILVFNRDMLKEVSEDLSRHFKDLLCELMRVS